MKKFLSLAVAVAVAFDVENGANVQDALNNAAKQIDSSLARYKN